MGLNAPLEPEQQRQLAAGIKLEEGLARLAGPLRPASSTETRLLATMLKPIPDQGLVWYRATLAQGWKRQLRRMFAAVGAPIARLARVRIGPVRLADLPSGRARVLKGPEIRSLVGAPPARPPRQHRSGLEGSGAKGDRGRRGGKRDGGTWDGAKRGGAKRDIVRLDGTRRRT